MLSSAARLRPHACPHARHAQVQAYRRQLHTRVQGSLIFEFFLIFIFKVSSQIGKRGQSSLRLHALYLTATYACIKCKPRWHAKSPLIQGHARHTQSGICAFHTTRPRLHSSCEVGSPNTPQMAANTAVWHALCLGRQQHKPRGRTNRSRLQPPCTAAGSSNLVVAIHTHAVAPIQPRPSPGLPAIPWQTAARTKRAQRCTTSPRASRRRRRSHPAVAGWSPPRAPMRRQPAAAAATLRLRSRAH